MNKLAKDEWRPINMTGVSIGEGGSYLVVLLEKSARRNIHEVLVDESNPLADVR